MSRRPAPVLGPPVLGAVLFGLLTGCSSGPADRVAASPVTVESSAPPLPADTGAVQTAAPSAMPSATPTPSSSATARPTPSSSRATPRPTLSAEVPVQPPRPPVESPPPVGRPTCLPSALTVTDADRTYTADAVQALFTVRTSGADCQLPSGYPSVEVVDAAGGSLGPATRGGLGLPAPAGVPITLSTTTSLSFYLATSRDGDCTPAARVAVTFPGTTAAVSAVTTLEVCGGALAVGPVQRLGDDE